MRRSLRDSIVGFSLLGGFIIFALFSFWLRGIKLSSKNWYFFAEFSNASGLSKKSPVTYRGILVGSVEDIIFTNESIKAKVVLNNPDIMLPQPTFAKVVTLPSPVVKPDPLTDSILSLKKVIDPKPRVVLNPLG